MGQIRHINTDEYFTPAEDFLPIIGPFLSGKVIREEKCLLAGWLVPAWGFATM